MEWRQIVDDARRLWWVAALPAGLLYAANLVWPWVNLTHVGFFIGGFFFALGMLGLVPRQDRAPRVQLKPQPAALSVGRESRNENEVEISADGRVFLTRSPTDLIHEFDSHPSYDAARISKERFEGRWLRLKAPIVDIHKRDTEWSVILEASQGQCYVAAIFATEHDLLVKSLRKGQLLSLEGCIQSIDAHWITVVEPRVAGVALA